STTSSILQSYNSQKRTVAVDEYFTDGSDDCGNGRERFNICQTLWEKIKMDTEVLQEELNTKILDSLLDFIKRCTSSFQSRTDDWTSHMRASEIPTAALVLGVNVPDHDVTFQSLSELLRKSVTPFAVSVQAKECAALKNLMQKVLERLMGVGVTLEDDEEDTGIHLPHKKVSCSVSALSQWYKSMMKTRAIKSPDKTGGSENGFSQSPPIIVIFKDFEAFNPRVLQDFILICNRYIQELPFIFIFGIATSPSTIQHMLPHSVSSLLCIELFQSLPCTQHLATVIDKLILTSQFPFKLSSKVLQVLVSIFLYHDFSVRNFVKGLQLALLEHFHSQPLSVLCCGKNEALLYSNPVFFFFFFCSILKFHSMLVLNSLTEVCQRFLKDLRKYHKNYYPVLKCLHSLTSSLPKYPLGKQIRELHISCMEKNVWETNEYESTLLEMKGTRRTKKISPFELLRNEALEFIDGLVRSYLTPPELQPLNEVCYYSSSGVLRRHLNATPRTSIQTALSHPFYYLQNESLKTDAGTVSNSAPDICIAYKLHLECGRLINLFDWLEAYATVTSAAEGKDPDSEDFGKVDELKHARFIQAVSELEFLGFVKSTKQKTDHVARLTWGGC
uniref:Origin recognition complex subunit 3 n=1 Tax=Astyanax mexicanus TaxID=7994 RepID=A0A8B9LCG6_ASTMX